MFRPLRFQTRQLLRTTYRHNSTTPTSPPLLTKLKADVKNAMRAKDRVRLDVLRAVISEVNNAAKTSSPIQTDIQLLGLLQKRSTSLEAAGKEFSEAGREDLKTKVLAEIDIVAEYAGEVKTTSVEEIQSAVRQTIEALQAKGKKPNVGEVIKTSFAEGGSLHQKPATPATVAKVAGEEIASLASK